LKVNEQGIVKKKKKTKTKKKQAIYEPQGFYQEQKKNLQLQSHSPGFKTVSSC